MSWCPVITSLNMGTGDIPLRGGGGGGGGRSSPRLQIVGEKRDRTQPRVVLKKIASFFLLLECSKLDPQPFQLLPQCVKTFLKKYSLKIQTT
jgi:hypothetical protein